MFLDKVVEGSNIVFSSYINDRGFFRVVGEVEGCIRSVD